ncbi:NADPH-dependent FMN reductase [Paracoccus aminophilus]|uniref:NADPH-dependent FMN reductase n=1 Tax=Paracoccus aminophilus JCM 7686 TaxID=1367847 RepID=S5XSL1_PARAH|nr:NAD(P)H-dependent oxidoreductase [Paracoccus aminophilus]AGT08097.1 NADPH-dependent FMN reductase [Paracoccus aminophilus JCM 7686]
MSTERKVAVLVGSLRKGSFSRKLAHALTELAPKNLHFSFVEIGDLPLYNEDLEADVPAAWARLRREIKGAEAVMFVTPEYNRSVPASIKNALDVGSRPYGQSVWDGKPALVVSGSGGGIGGFGANHHLRQSLVFLNMPVLQQPEAYIGGFNDLFDDQGKVKNEGTQGFLSKIMQAYGDWVAKILG